MHQLDILKDITICVATVGRPMCIRRLVSSVRARFGAIRILVGHQYDHLVDQDPLKDLDAEVFRVDPDFGVSATRNFLISKVNSNYFLLCDDDFIIADDTDLKPSYRILEARDDISIVGGKLFDLFDSDELSRQHPRYWERFINYNARNRILILTPLQQSKPLPERVGSTRFFICESVMHWALMRTSLFQDMGFGWDPQFKIAGEHEDFYLTLKLKFPNVKVAYCPEMIVYHHSPPVEGYGHLRSRMAGWVLFGNKWSVDQVIDPPYFMDCTKETSFRVAPASGAEFESLADEVEGRRQLAPNSIGFDKHGRIYHSNNQMEKVSGHLVFCPKTRKMAVMNEEMEEQMEAYKQRLGTADQQIAELQRQLDAIRTSTLWVATGPVRKVAGNSPQVHVILRRTLKILWWTITMQLPQKLRERRVSLAGPGGQDFLAPLEYAARFGRLPGTVTRTVRNFVLRP